MLLRSAREVGELIADGRRRLRWSQLDLAQRAGVSRQWVSQVENGKTTVEFDLVLGRASCLGLRCVCAIKGLDRNGRVVQGSATGCLHTDALDPQG